MARAKETLFRFDNMHYKDILAIEDLEISGPITALIGPSGSGKSTLFRLLNKLLSPSSGCIFYKGRDLQGLDSVSHRREVGMLSQSPVLFEPTIKDNLTYPFRLQNKPVPKDEDMERLLDRLQLSFPLDKKVDNLSGGEKQRIGLIRLILSESQVFLLDEPTSALDDSNSRIILEVIEEEVRERGRRVIMITHSQDTAFAHANEVVRMKAGKVLAKEVGNGPTL